MPVSVFVLGILLYEAISQTAGHRHYVSILIDYQNLPKNSMLYLQGNALKTLSAIILFLVSCSIGIGIAVNYIWNYGSSGRLLIVIGLALSALGVTVLISFSKVTYFGKDFFYFTETTLRKIDFFGTGKNSFTFSTFLYISLFTLCRVWPVPFVD